MRDARIGHKPFEILLRQRHQISQYCTQQRHYYYEQDYPEGILEITYSDIKQPYKTCKCCNFCDCRYQNSDNCWRSFIGVWRPEMERRSSNLKSKTNQRHYHPNDKEIIVLQHAAFGYCFRNSCKVDFPGCTIYH